MHFKFLRMPLDQPPFFLIDMLVLISRFFPDMKNFEFLCLSCTCKYNYLFLFSAEAVGRNTIHTDNTEAESEEADHGALPRCTGQVYRRHTDIQVT